MVTLKGWIRFKEELKQTGILSSIGVIVIMTVQEFFPTFWDNHWNWVVGVLTVLGISGSSAIITARRRDRIAKELERYERSRKSSF